MNYIRIDHGPRLPESKKVELKKVLEKRFELFQEEDCHYLIETDENSSYVYEFLRSQVQDIENLSVLDHTNLAHIYEKNLSKILKSFRECMTLRLYASS